MEALKTAPRPHADTAMPPVVEAAEWAAARERLLVEEKAHTRAGDALAARRRRLPMVRIEGEWRLTGPDGEVTLLDLFEGRRQLVLYHHMLQPGDTRPCPGCSAFGDSVPEHLEHLHARDATFAMVAEAPYDEVEAYRQRMGWTMPFYSQHGSTFGADVNPSPHGPTSFAVSVFLRDGSQVYRTWTTQGRGAEALANMVDVLPYGRQETFEDSPEGWPQAPTYSVGELHDEYSPEQLAGAAAPSSTGQVATAAGANA